MFDTIKANIEREKLQEEALDLSKKHPNLVLEWCTGLGKTLGALRIIESSNCKWLVVVPEVQLIHNFKEDIEKHSHVDVSNKIHDIICYASLHKYADTEFCLLLDEGHHAFSDLRATTIQSIKSKQVVLLSATLSEDLWEKLQGTGVWYKHTVSLKDAINRQILPEPKINIIYLDLDTKIKRNEFKTKKTVTKLTDREYYDKISASVDYWMKRYNITQDTFAQRKLFLEALRRKRWLTEYKTELAKKLLSTIKNKRFICFCGSVDQAKRLGSKTAIHSKNTRAKNLEIVKNFNNLTTNSIFSCNMVREGQNLVFLDCGVIIQLSGESLYNLQELGRFMRAISPVVYVIVVRNTQDNKYLSKFIENLEDTWISEFKL